MTRTITVSALFLALLSFSAVKDAGAEDAKMGRLPDGRAYRTDSAGYQLVDHIAELEVTVDELNRQLETMEDEIAEKDRQLAKVQGGKTAVPPVAPLPPAAGSRTTGDGEVLALRAQITALERDLAAARKAADCDYEAHLKPLREEIAGLRQALFSAPSTDSLSTIENQKRALEVSLSQTNKSIAQKESDLAEQTQQIAALTEELSEIKEQLQLAQGELSTRDSREKELLASLESAKRSAESAAQVTAARVNAAAEAQVFASTRQSIPRAMMGTRPQTTSSSGVSSEFKKRSSDIQSLIIKRKDLFDSLRGKNKGVSISLQELVTQRGVSLDSLRSLAKNAVDERTIRTVRLGLSEIQQLLEDDIRTMERLRKL